MGSITITADDEVIEQARAYAATRKTSLNALGRAWLGRLTVKPAKPARGNYDDIFDLMDKAQGRSRGQKWKREDLYRA